MNKASDKNPGTPRPSIELLGGFEFSSVDGEPIRLKTRKTQVLLAYLALNGGATQPRSKLIGLLWSTRSDEQASASLRQALSELRRQLDPIAPDALEINRQSATLDTRAIEVDALLFESLSSANDRDTLRRAAGLYAGDLLDGINVRDPECEQWMARERERFRLMAIKSLGRLLEIVVKESDGEAINETAHLLLQLDPLHESAHRALIRHYSETGQRPHALRQFESYKDRLQAELGVEPDAQTEALYRSICEETPTVVITNKNGRQVVDEDEVTQKRFSGAEIGLDVQSPVRYCLSGDRVSIAHAQVGKGKPLVMAGSWMTHLEKDWENPGYGHYLKHLAKDFTIIRYDQRGNGMSDWDDVDISFDTMVGDLKSVIDCYGHKKIALFGASQGASVSIAYTTQHPERVSRLVLYGGYPRGRRRRGNPEAARESEALVTLIQQGWGRENPAFRQTMTSLFMPDATQQENDWFNEFQKACGPGANIARFREMFDEIDVTELLEKISVPTLVITCVGDSVAPLSEGKLLASRIPGAQFVTLNSDNHMILERDPEFPRFLSSVRNFLKSA